MSGLSPQIGVFQTNRLYSQAERYPNIHVVMRSITNGLSHWPDSWVGIGHIAVGMARQGYDFQLTRYDARGWRATFYTSGMEHSITSATASAWERTPWRAVQGAAWDALRQASRDG